MFFRFFKEQKLFFIHQITIQNMLWLSVTIQNMLWLSIRWSAIHPLTCSKPPSCPLLQIEIRITNCWSKFWKFAVSAKQIYGMWQVVMHAKLNQIFFIWGGKSMFLFFILWNMEVFNKNKPCQQDWNCRLSRESWKCKIQSTILKGRGGEGSPVGQS